MPAEEGGHINALTTRDFEIIGFEIRDGQLLADNYRVERRLGSGGMGIVYLARDISLDIPVAIKILPTELSDNKKAIADLKKEAKTAITLTHENICRLYHFENRSRLKFLAS